MAAIGQLVAGRYRVVRPLATGGISRVWLARDEVAGRPVAIKECALPDGLTAGEQDLVDAWLLREARAFARVRHPNVVPILDLVPDGARPWIVMEYVPSRSLQQVVSEYGPLPPARVAEIGLAVLSGLTAAGRASVLHLDVKPGNVLIAQDGRVLLGDFGPVVTEAGVGALARAGIILGSPNYIAPERLFDGMSTARADLWSLGATLYFAVEGRPPFLRETTAAILQALDGSAPDSARLAGPLADVLSGLMRRDPSARLSAAELEERLREIAARGPRPLPAPAAGVPRPVRPPVPARRRAAVLTRGRAAVLAAVAAVGLTLAAAAAAAGTGDDPVTGGSGGGGAVALRAPEASQPTLALPTGFTWWTDRGGFRVAVPAGWRQARDADGALLFTAPQGRPSLRIRAWSPPSGDAVAGLIAAERDTGLTGYRRLRIEARSEPPEVVWEYTYRDAAGATRGLERVTEVGGRTYRIQWRASKSAWVEGLGTLRVVLDSFGPAPGGA